MATHLSTSKITTITREIFKKSATELLKVANTGIAEILSNEEFAGIERRLRVKVERIIKKDFPTWSKALMPIFLYAAYSGINQVNSPLAERLQKAAENIISKHRTFLNRPRELIYLFVDGLEKQFMDEYIKHVNSILREHSDASIFRYVLTDKLPQLSEDVALAIDKMLREKQFLTDTGHIVESDVAKRLNLSIDNLKEETELTNEAIAIYEDFSQYYSNNQATLKLSEELFQQQIIDTIVSILHIHIVGLIESAQCAVTSALGAAINVSTGLVPMSAIDLLQEGRSKVTDTILAYDGSKWASRQPQKSSLISYERIRNGRYDYYFPSKEEQLNDQNRYDSLYMGKISTDHSRKAQELCIDMIQILTKLLTRIEKKNSSFTVKVHSIINVILHVAVIVGAFTRTFAVIAGTLTMHWASSGEKFDQAFNQSKSTMIRLIQDNNLILWLANIAEDIAHFPNTIYQILKNPVILGITPSLQRESHQKLQREFAVDGYLNFNVLLHLANLLRTKRFAEILQKSFVKLTHPNSSVKTAIELLKIPNIGQQIYDFLEMHGDVYIDRIIRDNEEYSRVSGLDDEKTYSAILTKYKLNVADLKLLLPAIASIILEPLNIEKAFVAAHKQNMFQLMIVLYNHIINNEIANLALKTIINKRQEFSFLSSMMNPSIRPTENDIFLEFVLQSPGLVDTFVSSFTFLLDVKLPLLIKKNPDNLFSFVQSLINYFAQFDVPPESRQNTPFFIKWIKNHQLTLKSLMKTHFSGRVFSLHDIANIAQMIDESVELKAAMQNEQQANQLTKLMLSILYSDPTIAPMIQGLDLRKLLTNLLVNPSLIKGLASHQNYPWFKYLILLNSARPYMSQLYLLACSSLYRHTLTFIVQNFWPISTETALKRFSDYSELRLINLTFSGELNNKRFINSRLTGLKFDNATLRNICFHGAVLQAVEFYKTNMDLSTFINLLPQLRDKKQSINFNKCTVIGDLSDLNLSGISLEGISWRHCKSLQNTNIKGTVIHLPQEQRSALLYNTLGLTQEEYNKLLKDDELHAFWRAREIFILDKVCSLVIESVEVERGILLNEATKLDLKKIVGQQLFMGSKQQSQRKLAALTHDYLNAVPQDIIPGFHIKASSNDTVLVLKFLYEECMAQKWQLTTLKLKKFIFAMYIASKIQAEIPQNSNTSTHIKLNLLQKAQTAIATISENFLSLDKIEELIPSIKNEYLNEASETLNLSSYHKFVLGMASIGLIVANPIWGSLFVFGVASKAYYETRFPLKNLLINKLENIGFFAEKNNSHQKQSANQDKKMTNNK